MFLDRKLLVLFKKINKEPYTTSSVCRSISSAVRST